MTVFMIRIYDSRLESSKPSWTDAAQPSQTIISSSSVLKNQYQYINIKINKTKK